MPESNRFGPGWGLREGTTLRTPDNDRTSTRVPPRSAALVVALALLAAACGSNSGEVAVDSAPTPTSAITTVADSAAPGSDPGDATASGTGPVSLDASSFELCPVIIDHGAELAAMIGLELDPERGVEETFASECNFIGAEPGDFARIEIGSSFDGTVDGYIQTIDSEDLIISKVVELSPEARYATDGFEPRVVFSLGDRLVISVSARVLRLDQTTAVDYGTMVSFAARVRELLTEANS